MTLQSNVLIASVLLEVRIPFILTSYYTKEKHTLGANKAILFFFAQTLSIKKCLYSVFI